jgi:hypothetical protein
MTAPSKSRGIGVGAVVGLSVVAFVALVAVLTAGPDNAKAAPDKAAPRTAPTAAPAKVHLNSCAVCLERAPLLDPARYTGWENGDVKRAYEAAAKYPATIDLLHCFCECQESPREQHKTLLTCFTSQHAAGCGICQHEALMAAKLKDEGRSDEEVEFTVESLHKTDGHRPTKGRGL